MNRYIPISLALFAFTLPGCGKPERLEAGQKLVPVTGTLTLKGGQPLAGVVVTFHPQMGQMVFPSSGTTDESGRFTLVNDNQVNGITTGHHKVTLTLPRTAKDKDHPEPEKDSVSQVMSDIARICGSPDTTPLIQDVAGEGEIKLQIDPSAIRALVKKRDK